MWVDANIHATEVAGTTVALNIAHTLLTGYGTDAQITRLLDNITYCTGSYETMEDADALVVATEWDAFRALDLGRVKSLLRTPVLVDLRNIYPREQAEAAGFAYHGVGR